MRFKTSNDGHLDLEINIISEDIIEITQYDIKKKRRDGVKVRKDYGTVLISGFALRRILEAVHKTTPKHAKEKLK